MYADRVSVGVDMASALIAFFARRMGLLQRMGPDPSADARRGMIQATKTKL
jgi:hypothetical protein